MPNVDLIATKSFSYATRRLKAGDSFTVPERMAKVLVGIKKAEAPRQPGKVAAPPQEIIQRAEAVTPPPVRANPLDHDGDGKSGGSRKGPRRRRVAKKG